MLSKDAAQHFVGRANKFLDSPADGIRDSMFERYPNLSCPQSLSPTPHHEVGQGKLWHCEPMLPTSSSLTHYVFLAALSNLAHGKIQCAVGVAIIQTLWWSTPKIFTPPFQKISGDMKWKVQGTRQSDGRGCLGEGRLGVPGQVWEVRFLPSFPSFPRKFAVQKMSGRTPGGPRHPSSRHPRPSETKI